MNKLSKGKKVVVNESNYETRRSVEDIVSDCECSLCGAEAKMDAIETSIDESRRRGNQILSYWHCRQCGEEGLYPNIGVGWTPIGIQVWCENHNENVLHVDLCGNKVDIVSVERVA